MPKLNVLVDSLDDVDEAFHGLYRESDDGLVLNISGIDDHPDVVGLKKNQQRALTEAKKAKAERDELAEKYDGIDADQAREAIAKYEEWEAKGGVPDEDAIPRELHEKRVEAAKEQARKAEEKLQAEVQQKDQTIEQLVVRSELTSEIAKAGFLDEYHDDVFRALMSEGPSVMYDADGTPRGVFSDELENRVPIKDKVQAFAKSESAAKYMPASGNNGTGSGSGRGPRGGRGGANPFHKDSRNVTEQMRLMKENPEQARILAAEAGVRLPKTAA